MKFAVIADVHANLEAFRVVLDDAQKQIEIIFIVQMNVNVHVLYLRK